MDGSRLSYPTRSLLSMLTATMAAALVVGPGPASSFAGEGATESSQLSVDASEAVLAEVEELLLALETDLPEGGLKRPEDLLLPRIQVSGSIGKREQRQLEGPTGLGLERFTFAIEDTTAWIESSGFRPWAEALAAMARVESVRISMIDGTLSQTDSSHDSNGEQRSRFDSRHGFSIRGTAADGGLLFSSGEFDLTWRHAASGWRIQSWHDRRVEALRSVGPVFDDVTTQVVTPKLAEVLRRSPHEELVQQYLQDPAGFRPPHPAFHAVSHDRHPAVSVVDIDDDGWDDLYVMARWGRNALLRNRGDGSFEEVAEKYGLDIEGLSSCALFLDFDGDQDLDLFLCRTLERSRLLINEQGRYVDRSSLSAEPLPMYVASAAAADYDLDGRLDLYVATYAKTSTRGLDLAGVLSVDPSLPKPSDAALRAMALEQHSWTNVWGPANLLLRNLGGARFERAGAQAGARVFRHTFQASWADYDLDGYPDLYLANDYAPNNLLRNRGDGTFEDVTAESASADRGFGMGASWGDYDLDGRPDLYVSNMFSKAGRRVVGKLLGQDSALLEMARGNTLFRNTPGSFERVSSTPGYEVVEHTGWSWGGQFVDVDNDGWLDIAVLNGYYTVPAHLRKLPVDT